MTDLSTPRNSEDPSSTLRASLSEATLHALTLAGASVGGILGAILYVTTSGWIPWWSGAIGGLYVSLVLAYHNVRRQRDESRARLAGLEGEDSTWWREQAQRFVTLGDGELDAQWSVLADTGAVEWWLHSSERAPGFERLEQLFMAEARAAGLRLSRVAGAPTRFPWAAPVDPVDAWLNTVAAFPNDRSQFIGSGRGEQGRFVSGGITGAIAGSRLACVSLASGHRPDQQSFVRRVAIELSGLAEGFEREMNRAVQDGFTFDAVARLEAAADEVGAHVAGLCGPVERRLFLLAAPHSQTYSAVNDAYQHHWQKAAGRLFYLHALAGRWTTQP